MPPSSPPSSPNKRFTFPTLTFHCSLLAVVLALAVFRFFVQGELVHPIGNTGADNERRKEIGGGVMKLVSTTTTWRMQQLLQNVLELLVDLIVELAVSQTESPEQGALIAVFTSLRFAQAAAVAQVPGLSLTSFDIFTDSGDRHHCRSLLNTGRWLDSSHTSWQPEGCMLHPYTPKQVGQCLEGRTVVFMGDSTVRQVFCTLLNISLLLQAVDILTPRLLQMPP